MKTHDIELQHPLSSAQKDIWLDQVLHPDAPLYNIGGYTLVDLFEEQVEKTPESIAVLYAGEDSSDSMLTYRKLNAKANQLAHYLKRKKVGPDVVVGIFLERSIETVIAIMGILKAGGAYLPLDSKLPAKRLGYMVEHAQAPLVLIQEKLRSQFPAGSHELLSLDQDWKKIEQEKEETPARGINPGNLAYVLYTSGTTGNPKGIMIPHSSIVNHTYWMQETFPLGWKDTMLQKTPFSFDASVWEFFSPLSWGIPLVMAKPGGEKDGEYLIRTIRKYEITTLQLVPALLEMLMEYPEFEECHSLKRVFCGGEALSSGVRKKFFARSKAKLINLYGPSETTVDATYSVVSPDCPQSITPNRIPLPTYPFERKCYWIEAPVKNGLHPSSSAPDWTPPVESIPEVSELRHSSLSL